MYSQMQDPLELPPGPFSFTIILLNSLPLSKSDLFFYLTLLLCQAAYFALTPLRGTLEAYTGTSWQIDGKTMETVTDFIFWAPKSL